MLATGEGEVASGDVTDPVLQHVWSANGIRLLGDGVPGGDVAAARTQVTRWEQWYPFGARWDPHRGIGLRGATKL